MMTCKVMVTMVVLVGGDSRIWFVWDSVLYVMHAHGNFVALSEGKQMFYVPLEMLHVTAKHKMSLQPTIKVAFKWRWVATLVIPCRRAFRACKVLRRSAAPSPFLQWGQGGPFRSLYKEEPWGRTHCHSVAVVSPWTNEWPFPNKINPFISANPEPRFIYPLDFPRLWMEESCKWAVEKRESRVGDGGAGGVLFFLPGRHHHPPQPVSQPRCDRP